MELNSDFIALQGVLSAAIKITGEFTKIKYRGGNEKLISVVVNELDKFFERQNYITAKKVLNLQHKKEIQQILLFLILNCEFKNEFISEENTHLIGIIPKFSKCLFANVVVELNLGECCSTVFPTLPFFIQEEILVEILPCLKKSSANRMLRDTSAFLKQVILQLNNTENVSRQVEEQLEGLVEVSVEMLRYLGGLNTEEMKSWKARNIYQHMGFTFLNLLKLLQCCDNNNRFLAKIVHTLLQISCDVMKAVTVDVFCVWAEIEHEGEPLQTQIASSAYLTIEKYQKFKLAKELIQMLGTIARKPKSLQELIQQADASTMITVIEKCDGNQQQWFHALTNTHIFENEKSIACLEKFCYLCTADDIDRILNMSTNYDSSKVRKLALKCASCLPVNELAVVVTRYFRKFGVISKLDDGNVRNQLVLLLNKMKNSNSIDESFIREVLLLLLQNSEEVLKYFYSECLKSVVYSVSLKEVFLNVKEILVIESLATCTLINTLESFETNGENTTQIIQLLNILFETKCMSHEEFAQKLVPLLQKFLQEERFAALQNILYVFNEIYDKTNTCLPEQLLHLLILIMNNTRSTFFEFDRAKHETARECVKSLQRSINSGFFCDFLSDTSTKSVLNSFYIEKITSKHRKSLFEYTFADFNLDDYHKCLSQLVKIFPKCVPEEWISICRSLESISSFEKTIETLTDTLILLSHITKSQSEDSAAYDGLDFCLQSYGSAVKELMSSKSDNASNEVLVTKCVCRLLREMPKKSIEKNRCILIGLASDLSLQTLSTDKQFVCGLVAIEDAATAQMLAKKMLK